MIRLLRILPHAFGFVAPTFGRGGAPATNRENHPDQDLVLAWMIQQTGGFPGKGAEARSAFKQWVAARFAK